MNKNLAVAALAGLLSATVMTAGVANASEHGAKAEKVEAAKSAKEKHACKGLNSCKGNSPDGKNQCKGKSACATDGSK
jgi:hypothetical protein